MFVAHRYLRVKESLQKISLSESIWHDPKETWLGWSGEKNAYNQNVKHLEWRETMIAHYQTNDKRHQRQESQTKQNTRVICSETKRYSWSAPITALFITYPRSEITHMIFCFSMRLLNGFVTSYKLYAHGLCVCRSFHSLAFGSLPAHRLSWFTFDWKSKFKDWFKIW